MSKSPRCIEVSSYSEIIERLPEIADAFRSEGLALIRGHKFSKDEHIQVTKLLGDIFDWSACSESSEDLFDLAYYVAGQSSDPNRAYDQFKKDSYFLDWHIEQVYLTSPPMAGIWYLEKFTGKAGSGETRFVDSSELYENLTESDKEFLNEVIVFWDKPTNSGEGPFYTKVVDQHRLINKPVLRIETDNGCYIKPTVYSVSGKAPSDEDHARFKSIVLLLKKELYENRSIRYEQIWQEGDFLVVDLFRMYHAVMGGFKFGERIMPSVGATSRSIDKHNVDTKADHLYTRVPEIIN
jgi:alpha-ketoglutarate-dependent taurine dioxygenase